MLRSASDPACTGNRHEVHARLCWWIRGLGRLESLEPDGCAGCRMHYRKYVERWSDSRCDIWTAVYRWRSAGTELVHGGWNAKRLVKYARYLEGYQDHRSSGCW